MANNCDCNDYSLLTANTGLATVSVANGNLDGSGTLATVLTAGQNGTIIKSIIVKSIAPTNTGMVRLYVNNNLPGGVNLVREIPIPTYPMTLSTPTPPIIWPMIEIDLVEPLKLKAGYLLQASTQNAESFNIIAEGLDWEYPAVLPDTCCNFLQETENTGVGKVSTANRNLDGTGAIVDIYSVPASPNGSRIKSITIAALQSTHKGMIRLFLTPDSVTYYLMMEIMIPETTQSSFQPSFKVLMEEEYHLKADYRIGASTELGEQFAITIEGVDWEYPI